jgi:hypothetical protein
LKSFGEVVKYYIAVEILHVKKKSLLIDLRQGLAVENALSWSEINDMESKI